MTPEEMQARVLYRDGLMLVIDKPAGLPVHRGPKGGASLEDYFDALRFGLPRAPALAHRLDRETSGCLVLGRHRKALAHLGLLFKHGEVAKTYWAVVEGGPEADEGMIELPLGRLNRDRGWWMKPDPAGQPAVTTWKVLGRGHDASRFPPGQVCFSTVSSEAEAGAAKELNNAATVLPHDVANTIAWLALEPLTGRTHQLRVHCAAMGWPILGDAIYGTAPRLGGPGLQLHAREIAVPLGKNRPPARIIAPVPAHMRGLLGACGFCEE